MGENVGVVAGAVGVQTGAVLLDDEAAEALDDRPTVHHVDEARAAVPLAQAACGRLDAETVDRAPRRDRRRAEEAGVSGRQRAPTAAVGHDSALTAGVGGDQGQAHRLDVSVDLERFIHTDHRDVVDDAAQRALGVPGMDEHMALAAAVPIELARLVRRDGAGRRIPPFDADRADFPVVARLDGVGNAMGGGQHPVGVDEDAVAVEDVVDVDVPRVGPLQDGGCRARRDRHVRRRGRRGGRCGRRRDRRGLALTDGGLRVGGARNRRRGLWHLGHGSGHAERRLRRRLVVSAFLHGDIDLRPARGERQREREHQHRDHSGERRLGHRVDSSLGWCPSPYATTAPTSSRRAVPPVPGGSRALAARARRRSSKTCASRARITRGACALSRSRWPGRSTRRCRPSGGRST